MPVFAGWHAVTHACESQEQKGIPGIGQYICGNDISTIEDKKFLGRLGKERTGKWNTFKDCHRMDSCSLKMVIIVSFGVRVGPTSSQTARGERPNPENTPRLHQEARSTLKFSLK